jgi:hypothetical protein
MDGQGDFRAHYTFGYDSPEGYAIEKDGKMFYAFYSSSESPSLPLKTNAKNIWKGEVELRGLRPGAYKVVDYANNKDLGIIRGPTPSRLHLDYRECTISCIGARLVSQTHCPSEKSSYKYRSGQLHWGWVHCLRACRAPRSSRSSCPPNRTQHNSPGNSSRSQPHAVRTRRARHRRSCVDPALRNSFRVLPLTCCNQLNHLDTFRFKLDAPFRAIPNSRGLEDAGVVAPPRKFGFHLFL